MKVANFNAYRVSQKCIKKNDYRISSSAFKSIVYICFIKFIFISIVNRKNLFSFWGCEYESGDRDNSSTQNEKGKVNLIIT